MALIGFFCLCIAGLALLGGGCFLFYICLELAPSFGLEHIVGLFLALAGIGLLWISWMNKPFTIILGVG